jgi:hypothetical protein
MLPNQNQPQAESHMLQNSELLSWSPNERFKVMDFKVAFDSIIKLRSFFDKFEIQA